MLASVNLHRCPPEINHFRPRRDGPERLMQDQIASRIPDLFSAPYPDVWAGASLPIGAGLPDLVISSFHRQVLALASVELTDAEVLAYLRAVGRAKLDTIAQRMSASKRSVERTLSALVEAQAVTTREDLFILSPLWRDILPEIMTIEVKVSNWQKAVEQASRNRIFAHRSFVALPDRVAERVREEELVGKLGLGVLAVSDAGDVRLLRKARRTQPLVWVYYYKLAAMLAKSFTN